MIAPFWLKLRIGPYLRGERDKRDYFKLFHAGGAVSGIARLWLLGTAQKIDVFEARPQGIDGRNEPLIYRFHNALKDNEKKSFDQIRGHGAFLRAELLGITRRRYWPVQRSEPFIAIHVRMGDFTRRSDERAAAAGETNTSLPIHWYCDRLRALRAALGHDVPARIFSDGTDGELEPLLAMAGAGRPEAQQSVTDLLDMGRGIALISSGSGFSLWGAFLGGAPRLCHPGQMIVRAYDETDGEIESGMQDTIPGAFVSLVKARMERGPL